MVVFVVLMFEVFLRVGGWLLFFDLLLLDVLRLFLRYFFTIFLTVLSALPCTFLLLSRVLLLVQFICLFAYLGIVPPSIILFFFTWCFLLPSFLDSRVFSFPIILDKGKLLILNLPFLVFLRVGVSWLLGGLRFLPSYFLSLQDLFDLRILLDFDVLDLLLVLGWWRQFSGSKDGAHKYIKLILLGRY